MLIESEMKIPLLMTLMFIFGIVAGSAYSLFYFENFDKENNEKPLGGNDEKISPYPRVRQDQIKVFDDKVEIDFGRKITWATYTNSNSMDPILDERNYGIGIVPRNTNEIHVGDVIAYKYGNSIIVHRVVDIGSDEQGWYAITKGDNNGFVDPVKVRFNMINEILAAIIY